MKNNDTPTVYSTESGKICPTCGFPVLKCTCKKEQIIAAGDGVVRIRLETKGRGGKVVTTITGLMLGEAALRHLAGELKRRCGTGGTVKDQVIEIQGDHRELIVNDLKARGFTVKKAGG